MKGFIKLNRSLYESEIWLKDPFSRGQAWVDLLLLASYKESYFWVRGNLVELERGQSGASQLTMAKRWRWSPKRVRKFLKDLEKLEMIALHTSQQTSIVTICNYSKYQDGVPTSDLPNVPTDDLSEEQQTTYIQEGKEGKEVRGPASLTEIINYISSRNYPLPQAKREAEKFILYYEGRGWTTGKNNKPLDNWKLAAVNWLAKVPIEKHTPTISELRAKGEL